MLVVIELTVGSLISGSGGRASSAFATNGCTSVRVLSGAVVAGVVTSPDSPKMLHAPSTVQDRASKVWNRERGR